MAPFCRLLRRYWTHVDWARYWQRAAFLGAMSVFNTLLGSVDWLLYRRDMAAQVGCEGTCLLPTGRRTWCDARRACRRHML